MTAVKLSFILLQLKPFRKNRGDAQLVQREPKVNQNALDLQRQLSQFAAVTQNASQEPEGPVTQKLESLVNQKVESLVNQRFESLINQKLESLVNQKLESLINQKSESLVNRKLESLVNQELEDTEVLTVSKQGTQ